MALRTLWLTLLCASGCRAPAAASGDAQARLGPIHQVALSTTNLGIEDLDGLSGLTRDGEGALWTVPERARLLLRLGENRVDRRLTVVGIPDELDVEALAWVGGDRFALGTESHDPYRKQDTIYYVQRGDTQATVYDALPIDYSTLPIQAAPNQGIEGLCFAEGHLLAAFEEPLQAQNHRYGVLFLRTPEGAHFTSLVELTSDVGKLAGLDCRLSPANTLEVIAIERHFGVRRVLAFEVPLGRTTPVKARVVSDLHESLDSATNPEGIAWDAHGIALIVDNHYKVRTGPCELLHFEAEAGGKR